MTNKTKLTLIYAVVTLNALYAGVALVFSLPADPWSTVGLALAALWCLADQMVPGFHGAPWVLLGLRVAFELALVFGG